MLPIDQAVLESDLHNENYNPVIVNITHENLKYNKYAAEGGVYTKAS